MADCDCVVFEETSLRSQRVQIGKIHQSIGMGKGVSFKKEFDADIDERKQKLWLTGWGRQSTVQLIRGRKIDLKCFALIETRNTLFRYNQKDEFILNQTKTCILHTQRENIKSLSFQNISAQ